MRKMIWIIFLSISSTFSAQHPKDTLESWIGKFYKLTNPSFSEDGKWVAVKKRYDYNQDTIVVLNTQKPYIPVVQSDLGGAVSFLKRDGILIFGKSKAEFRNLDSGKGIRFDNVKAAYPLSETGQFTILSKDSILSVYNSNGSKLYDITGVQGLPVTDLKKKLYIARREGHTYGVFDLSGNKAARIYTTKNEIKKVELAQSGQLLIVLENENGKENMSLTIIRTKNGKVDHPEGTYPQKAEMSVSEIQNGKAYLISFGIREKPKDHPLIDIWYGNDTKLGSKKFGSIKYRYWLWTPDTGELKKIPNEKFPVIASLNSERYFLTFDPDAGHNYITRLPQFTMHLYDARQDAYKVLGNLKGVHYGSPEIVSSPDGKYIVVSEDGKKWTFVEAAGMTKKIIDRQSLQNPVFSSDNQYIFFESKDDIWKYDIKKGRLAPLKIAAGKETRIITDIGAKKNTEFNFFVSVVDNNKPILIKVLDVAANKTSFVAWYKGRTQTIISETFNNIEKIIVDESVEKFCVIEGNYNFPSSLFYIDSRRQTKQMLLEGNVKDKKACLLKQEIISYTNSDGKPLKGILYYPEDYNQQKKYPMIVRIYQVQSDISNEYHTPGYSNPIGFDLRALIKQGYFVYLPDIVFNISGTGLSALDCVNKALDALSGHPNIDVKRVGLMGHSHGAYETNFIATRSRRFAAYLSGAGNSDIVRSYFSYNYNFTSPFYWQYENGQYEMNTPFAENKELYFKNNPVYEVDKVNAPILLWAGQKDENIAWDQTMEFYIGLKRNKKQVIALFYPHQGHALGTTKTEEKKDLYKRVLEWWDYFLKDRKNAPWIDQQMKKDAL